MVNHRALSDPTVILPLPLGAEWPYSVATPDGVSLPTADPLPVNQRALSGPTVI
jgi:hypothetical protein